jgi:beta-N-acetylhexosaminidase
LSTDSPPAPVIFGCHGLELTPQERDFFAAARPAGFILFARNCQNRAQVSDLVADLAPFAGTSPALILIDQEGGRVQRLSSPEWRVAPPAATLGRLVESGMDVAIEAIKLNTLLIASELTELGINTNCAPVVDVPAPGSHDIIGDRAFSGQVSLLSQLARVMAETLLDGGVLPVIKHLPGHGRALADSHLELPTVDVPRPDLDAVDFAAFQPLADMPLGMTAHIVYPAIDSKPATQSSAVIQDVIREQIGFDGLLMTDDLSMQALTGSFAQRAEGSLAAGCDIVLHCNGDMAEMTEIAIAVEGKLSTEALDRLLRAQALIRTSPQSPPDDAVDRLTKLLADNA